MMMNRNVVRKSGERFNKDMSCIEDKSFIQRCRLKVQHFTRRRKLSVEPLVLSILNRTGVTLSMDIRRFFRLFKSNRTDTISNAGYLKQRMKLNPAAFLYLSDFHVKNFYSDEMDKLKTLKSYFLFAIDGSKVNLPNTHENQMMYGAQANQSVKQAQAGISCLYDVLNMMILDCTVNHITFSERSEAEQHIRKIPQFIGDRPSIIILDRGYPSSFLLMNMMEAKQKFVVRLSSKDFKKEQKSMATDDEYVEVKFTQARINPYRKTARADKLRKIGSMHIRFVKIILPGNQVEVLATNLSKEEFSSQEVGKIYGLRWGVETAYDTLKNKFMIENFTSRKPIIIEQDIMASVYLYNLTTDIVRDAEVERQEHSKNKHYKYEMKINLNTSIGIIKEDLIRMALEKNHGQRTKMFGGIIEELGKHVIPIRDNRKYPRNKKKSVYKDPVSRKRSF